MLFMLKYFTLWVIIKIIQNTILQFYSRGPNFGKCLLLIAHPDDESLFFAPFLYHNDPYIYCLSDGNFAGKGHLRRIEMDDLCEHLSMDFTIGDYKDNTRWSTDRILIDLVKMAVSKNIRTIVTFDKSGVTGHHNHISCSKAGRLLQSLSKKGLFKVHQLKSVGFFEQFLMFLSRPTFAVPFYSPFSIRLFLFHRSQVIWFRYIVILFSTYMHYNVFV